MRHHRKFVKRGAEPNSNFQARSSGQAQMCHGYKFQMIDSLRGPVVSVIGNLGIGICFGSRISVLGFVSSLVSALCLAAFSASALVYETPTEFQAGGDFDGDGRADVLLLDKATGGYRIGYQTASGVVTWATTRAAGIQNVTGIGVGRLTATNRDAFICTAPEANRFNLIDAPGADSVVLPVAVYIGSIGPNMAGVIDIGGGGNNAYDDLFGASIWNSGTPNRLTMLRNTNGTSFGILLDVGAVSRIERANRVSLKVGTTNRLGVISRGATDTFRAYDLSSGSIVQTFAQELPAGSEYIVERFNPTNLLSQFLSYRPGTRQLVVRQVLELSPGSFSLGPAAAYTLGQRIQGVYVILGGSNPRLLVIYDGGYNAEVFDFDGFRRFVPVQQFTAAPREAFTGAAMLGNGHFQLFSGDPGTRVSTRYQTWNFNGTTYTAGQGDQLPYIGRLSAPGNVLLFRYEPFVTNNPHLVRVLNAGDWTSQFRYTGAPPVVTVTAERFAGLTNGLRNPTITALGLNPPLANFGLVNQFTNIISVFSLRAPAGDEVSEVRIAPNPGRYANAIEMTLTTTDPTHQAYYRLGSAAWQLYSAPVRLFTNVTVQFYAKPPTGLAKSAIQSATYSFAQPPSALDSDDDGVPDFVELGKGLDPNGGSDSDGDGYSDLEELIRMTDPLSPVSAPTNSPRIEFKTAFNRAVTPRPYDGPANVTTYAATDTPMRVYAVQGSLLSAGAVTNLSISGVTNPACLLTNIIVAPEDRLLVEATELHYDILTANADKRLGRELVGLLSAPRFVPVQIPYSFGGGNLATEANAWIAAASNAWSSLTREVSKGDLTVHDTLAAALVEHKLGQILVSRGQTWGTNITLFPFRASDAGRSNVTRSVLLWLEKETTNGLPGWRMHSVYSTISNLVETSTDGNIVNLRAVALEIFDICSTYNNSNPAAFVPPLDELRYFLTHCTYDSNYLARSTFSNIFASACTGAATVIGAVQPRPVTNLIVVATASAPGQPADGFHTYGGSTVVLLYKDDGASYDLPDSFGVVPGSLLLVRGYTDLTNPPGCLALEVISVSLTSVPVASDSDRDGNLLVDTWEQLFFGSGTDPFGDWDHDGYQNLQEMFDGSDPRDLFGVPLQPQARFELPRVELIRDGAQIRLRFGWPSAYISRFVFGVKGSPNLNTPFVYVPATGPLPAPMLQNTFDLLVPVPESASYFYFIYVALR